MAENTVQAPRATLILMSFGSSFVSVPNSAINF